MKRLFVLMTCAVLLSACATRSKPMAKWTPPATASTVLTDANGNVIETVPFRPGISSVTVEKMAEAQGCVGGQGAGLMTPQGPVEVYRMICDSRQVFMARCELRQCRQVSAAPAGGYAVARPAPVSNVYEATVPAVVSTAPVAAPTSAPAMAMPSAQVPRLAFYWKCGVCVKNEFVPPMIAKAYAAEAQKNGYTVSATETAAVSIVGFKAGGKDMAAKIYYKDKVLDIEDAKGNSDTIARKAFEQLRAPK